MRYEIIIFGNQDEGEEYIIENSLFEDLDEADKYLQERLKELGKKPYDGKIKAL